MKIFNRNLSKIEVTTVLLGLILFVAWLGINISQPQTLSINANNEGNISSIQREVDKYFHNNVRFPTNYQPTIGFPSKIDVNLLGVGRALNEEHIYMVDAYGEVYLLTEDFLPPQKIELIFNRDGDTYLRWDIVENAHGYGIREITTDRTSLMDKAFGKLTASLMNVSSKGKLVVEKETDYFNRVGEDYLKFEVENFNPNSIYVVYAINVDIGRTPGVTRGYFMR